VVRPVPAAIDTLRARRDWEIEVGWPKAGEEIERQRPETRNVGASSDDVLRWETGGRKPLAEEVVGK
jgi:hypothetical protein